MVLMVASLAVGISYCPTIGGAVGTCENIASSDDCGGTLLLRGLERGIHSTNLCLTTAIAMSRTISKSLFKSFFDYCLISLANNCSSWIACCSLCTILIVTVYEFTATSRMGKGDHLPRVSIGSTVCLSSGLPLSSISAFPMVTDKNCWHDLDKTSHTQIRHIQL